MGISSFLCETKDIEMKLDFPLSRLTTVRIGGNATAVLFPKNVDEVTRILLSANRHSVPLFVMGNGSNILAPDNGFSGAVMVFGRLMSQIDGENGIVQAESGTRLSMLYSYCRHYNLNGAEFMPLIPATLGGAIVNNAGCFGCNMSDVVKEIYAVRLDEYRIFTADEAEFSYRNSFFKRNRQWVIVGAKLHFDSGFDSERAESFSRLKRVTQPLRSRSMGSVFLRENDIIPARIIDELGLKGLSVGGAQVSRIHAGFIVNADNATCEDVLTLLGIITDEVKLRRSITLQPEIDIITEDKF